MSKTTNRKKILATQVNETVREFDERDVPQIPAASDILQMIALFENHNFKDSATEQELKEIYSPLATKILQYCVDKDLNRKQLSNITRKFDRIFATLMDSLINVTLNLHQFNIEKKVFGNTLDEITFKQMDEILKK